MRTVDLFTADELVTRWKRRAMDLSDPSVCLGHGDYELGQAQGYRCAAAELLAILTASMEMEGIHHDEPEDPNALREWLAGERP